MYADDPITTPTPYERLLAEKVTTGPGRPRLNDYQREARKHANHLAKRRATFVLIARYKAEFLALQKAERHALYAKIDAANARGEQPAVDTL